MSYTRRQEIMSLAGPSVIFLLLVVLGVCLRSCQNQNVTPGFASCEAKP